VICNQFLPEKTPSKDMSNQTHLAPYTKALRARAHSLYPIGVAFFFLMLLTPASFQGMRGAALLVITVYCVVRLRRGEWRVHQGILSVAALCLAASIFFIVYGVLNETPGAIAVTTVYFLWPCLYLFFCGLVSRREKLIPFLRVIPIAGLAVIASNALFILDSSGFSFVFLQPFFEAQLASFADYSDELGFYRLSLINITTLIFAVPFTVTSLAIGRTSDVFSGYRKWVAIVFIFCSIFLLLLAGRRGIWLAFATCIPIFFTLAWYARVSQLRMLAFKLSIILLLAAFSYAIASWFFDLHASAMVDDFLAGFGFDDSKNISAYRRAEQFAALVAGWKENLLLGAGHGAAAVDNLGIAQSWSYELSYMALLFQTGLVGTLIYSASVLWLFHKSATMMRNRPESVQLLLPSLVGLASLLVANATNPYLLKFDYLWTLFLPVALLNCVLLARSTFDGRTKQLKKRSLPTILYRS